MDNFQHRPVLAQVAPAEVVTDPDGIYVDGTFGRGGHSRLILQRLSAAGRLIAFDRDPQAVSAAASITDPRFRIIHAPFSSMAEELARAGVSSVRGVFLDIGVSSPQIDDPARGFSFRFDGPLDMRMDTSCGQTAAQWIADASEAEMARVLREFGEERFAGRIARAICQRRESRPIETTADLAALIAASVPRNRKDPGQHPATRSFQAIRIAVNGELDELAQALEGASGLLCEGGRLAVISFHSLEDRIVKRFFARASRPDAQIDHRVPLRTRDLPQPWYTDVHRILPDAQECEENPRARSSVLRVGSRTARLWPAGGLQP